MILTGRDGQLKIDGGAIVKCRRFSIDINRDALETTALNEDDRNYVAGLRGAVASATVIYKTDDTPTVALFESIYTSTSKVVAEFNFSLSLNKKMSYDVLVTQVGTPVATGEVTVTNITMQMTGPRSGGGF
jgi:hypothetical protein